MSRGGRKYRYSPNRFTMRHDDFTAIDPTTGRTLETYAVCDPTALDHAVDRAVNAARQRAQMSVADRVEPLARLEDLLTDRADAWARLAAREMGKPLAEGRAEVRKCAWLCRVVRERAARWLAPDPLAAEDGVGTWQRYDPLGVIFGIMPWNYPFWQVVRFAVPALAAGNSVLMKHASNVPGCSLALQDAFTEVFGPDAFQQLFITHDQTSALIEDDRIAGVSLTGSEGAGRAVGALAGGAIKPQVLELGGSDPFLVLPEADLDAAMAGLIASRMGNAGQSCIAAKRVILHTDVRDAFIERLLPAFEALTVGDPGDEATDLGPVARADLAETVRRQVEASVNAGARILAARDVPSEGFFVPPTVLAAVRPGMPAFDEEIFGPVIALIDAPDVETMVELANRSRYGLGASIWTRDSVRGAELAVRLEAGNVHVNEPVKSDPNLPFGGVKRSGVGKEMGRDGMRAFTMVKTIRVRETDGRTAAADD